MVVAAPILDFQKWLKLGQTLTNFNVIREMDWGVGTPFPIGKFFKIPKQRLKSKMAAATILKFS